MHSSCKYKITSHYSPRNGDKKKKKGNLLICKLRELKLIE